MAKREKTTTATEKAPRQPLTKAERVLAYEVAGGKCHVLGTPLGPFDEWTVTKEGDTLYLLSPEAKRLKGQRTMEELRKSIGEELDQATADAVLAERALEAARERLAARLRLFEALRSDGAIVFAGERTQEATEA